MSLNGLFLSFSALCDFLKKSFFPKKNFKRSPLWVFWYFATECLLINPEGSPLLHFSALYDFFWKKKFYQKFQFFSKKSVLRFLSLRYGADFRRSRLVSSGYNPHTDRSTFLTILTIVKSYNSYFANLKYWRKSLRSSIFTSSKKLKGYSLRVFSALWDFFRKKNSPKGPPSIFLEFSDRTDVENSQRVPLSVFSALWDFFQIFFTKSAPPIFFDDLSQNGWKISVSPLVRQFGSTFGFFRYRRRVLWHFEVLLLFLSLRYGADLGRSRLVFTKITQSAINFLVCIFKYFLKVLVTKISWTLEIHSQSISGSPSVLWPFYTINCCG